MRGLILLATATAFLAAFAGSSAAAVHWGFESKSGASAQGWKQTADPSEAGPGLVWAAERETAPFNPEGKAFLSTGETDPGGTESDGLKAVWESPGFKVSHGWLSLLVRATTSRFGDNGRGTWVAVCQRDTAQPRGCSELTRLDVSTNSKNFRYLTIDVGSLKGRQVFIQVVDESATRRIAVDNIRANAPLMPLDFTPSATSKGPRLTWSMPADQASTKHLLITRSNSGSGKWTRAAKLRCRNRTCPLSLVDRKADPKRAWHYRIVAIDANGVKSEANRGYVRTYANPMSPGPSRTYSGNRLSAIAFPVGGIGSSGILHLGDGRRNQAMMFNTYGDQHGRTDFMVPNSFFAIRAVRPGGKPVVRALQTVPEGPFAKVEKLGFSGEYPFASYRFQDRKLPVQVKQNVFSPTIPGNAKDSAIPVAVYEFELKNPRRKAVRVSLLATQQNAAGLDGLSEVTGSLRRENPGYGSNTNKVSRNRNLTRLELTGDAGSIALSTTGPQVGSSAAWSSLPALHRQFRTSGKISGPTEAGSPAPGVTVDAGLTRTVVVPAGKTRKIRVILSWNFPERSRIFGGSGVQYSNWWSNANQVDNYVRSRFKRLSNQTRKFHEFLFGSKLPKYVLRRLSGNIATLRSPSMFWAENGFFGGWEGWGCCWNMPTHVWHYAQTQARLWPEIGRRFESQWLAELTPEGLIPYRYDRYEFAVDGQLGVVLASYRDHLGSKSDAWLERHWESIARTMDYVIEQIDADRDGVPGGTALTTLDFLQAVDGPWVGGLYAAGLDAASRMASATGDSARAATYRELAGKARATQNSRYWADGYFTSVANPDPSVRSQAGALDIDMLLGQWWGEQLDLDPVYGQNRMKKSLRRLYRENYRASFTGPTYHESHPMTAAARVFVEPNDGGMIASTWPDGGEPKAKTVYWDEVWPGREYTAAATMIGQGNVRDGLELVKAVDDRYDGRLRDAAFMAVGPPARWLETCHAGEGTGNPFGDDECGNWYGRSLSSWSLLLALQGFSYNGPAGHLGFSPPYRPTSHRSFFTAGDAWGVFSQNLNRKRFRVRIRLGHGRLRLNRLELGKAPAGKLHKASVKLNGKPLRLKSLKSGKQGIRLDFRGISLRAGSTLTVTAARR